VGEGWGVFTEEKRSKKGRRGASQGAGKVPYVSKNQKKNRQGKKIGVGSYRRGNKKKRGI